MILLDTHVWVWFVSNPELLSKKAAALIERAVNENGVYISCISTWEVALLVSKKRLVLTLEADEWIAKSETIPFITFIPVDNHIAVKSVSLPGPLHDDPADRIITATSLSSGFPLITKDKRLHDYPHVKTIW